MMNRKIISVLTMALVAGLSFAKPIKDGELKEPGKNTVILVGKVVASPINLEARRKALGGDNKLNTKKYDETLAVFAYDGRGSEKGFGIHNAPAIGEYCYETAKVKDGKVFIKNACVKLFPMVNAWFFIPLPMNVTVTIPEGAEYVYIGDFTYTLDQYLCPTAFEHFDTFKAAQEDINRATGKEVELYRGVLSFNK